MGSLFYKNIILFILLWISSPEKDTIPTTNTSNELLATGCRKFLLTRDLPAPTAMAQWLPEDAPTATMMLLIHPIAIRRNR